VATVPEYEKNPSPIQGLVRIHKPALLDPEHCAMEYAERQMAGQLALWSHINK
jgi:hypothetical protein